MKNLSNEWIIVYFKAIDKAWKETSFKSELLSNASQALKDHFKFETPSHLSIKFVEVGSAGTIEIPSFDINVFNKPSENINLEVPLIPAPKAGEDSLNYLNNYNAPVTVMCCCACI